MGEPGGLPSLGSHRVGHNWSDLVAAAAGPLFSTSQLQAIWWAPWPTRPSVLSTGLADHRQTQMMFLFSFTSWLKRLHLPVQNPLSMRTCWVPTLAQPRLSDLLPDAARQQAASLGWAVEPSSFSVSCVITDVLLRHTLCDQVLCEKPFSWWGRGGRNAH